MNLLRAQRRQGDRTGVIIFQSSNVERSRWSQHVPPLFLSLQYPKWSLPLFFRMELEPFSDKAPPLTDREVRDHSGALRT